MMETMQHDDVVGMLQRCNLLKNNLLRSRYPKLLGVMIMMRMQRMMKAKVKNSTQIWEISTYERVQIFLSVPKSCHNVTIFCLFYLVFFTM
jgi:hypothetical protein